MLRNPFIFIIVICLFPVVACSRYPKEVERVLRLAGDNRSELEHVLEHYSRRPGDSLKYRAAEFLIAHMENHYSADARPPAAYHPMFEEWKLLLQKDVVHRGPVFDSLVYAYRLQSSNNKLPDVQYIKADYLINNIDLAFEMREKQPWGKDIPFDIFLEQVLPYRVSKEYLEDWRSIILEQYKGLIDSMQTIPGIDAMQACCMVNATLVDKWKGHFPISSIPPLNYTMLMESWSGNCKERSTLGVFVMRALGIPVTQEFTPQWPNRHMGHSWNTVYGTYGRQIVFMATDSDPGKPHEADSKKGKVYRRTYQRQTESLAVQSRMMNIPPLFCDPYFKDVSSEYFENTDVQMTLRNPVPFRPEYAYLSVFDNRQWVPVQWGKVDEGKVCFPQMERGVVYLPLYHNNDNIYAADYPFLLTEQGEVRFLTPDTTQLQTVLLLRKYPLLMKWTDRMKGGRFESAHRADFSDARTLYTIDFHPDLYFQEVILDPPANTRYIRYMSPDDSHGNIAELEFYAEGDSLKPLSGTIMGAPESYSIHYSYARAFDGDVLTFFDTPGNDAWVGLDLGKPERIKKIRYLPRNDDNIVVAGQTYELFYFGNKGWVSLGRQTPTKQKLYYDHAPVNALFLLRNLSKGAEERIFTYEDGKQVWW